ncbi:MAG: DUF488 domain-containing protein [Gammaproteobacteria bacterium]|nr:DUF488 domain-containing protein [Gammaproteobacteria bacterium]
MSHTVFTIGHSTRSLEEFLALLRQFEVRHLADVRAIPRSRTNPQFNGDTLPQALGAAGISYRHAPALGGRRRRGNADPARNALWRNEAFHAYADHAETAEFKEGLEEVLEAAQPPHLVVMCAESLWWRCHRRIIADYLLAWDLPVAHIMSAGKSECAKLTPGAQVTETRTVRYPAAPSPQQGLPFVDATQNSV